MELHNTFIIVREDLVLDPVTIITESLLIGRLKECDLLLNHPSVSRTQAGIRKIDEHFYLFNLRPTNPVKLNRRTVEKNEALADGDVLEVGPFILRISLADGALVIRVAFQIGRQSEQSGQPDASGPVVGTQKLPDLAQTLEEGEKRRPTPRPRAAPLPSTRALDIFWDKRIREAGKIVRTSPLFPLSRKRTGKAQAYWTPTTDLSQRRPFAYLIWGALAVGLISLAATAWYSEAFSPAPLSDAHARRTMTSRPPIAERPNANSCMTCHALTSATMETRCSSCHRSEVFEATIIEPHRAAGITCADCHAEHRGADFEPGVAALETCSRCHTDANPKLYNGRRTGTPHGGREGYPVVGGKWVWKGVEPDVWEAKRLPVARASGETDEQWRSKQFHALHLYRVRAAEGLARNASGEMSCSSCHTSFAPIDRETPPTTCARCHNGKTDSQTGRVLLSADTPNCTSCHIQHVKDKRHWNPSLLAAREALGDNK